MSWHYLNSWGFQTTLYCVFVLILQLLANTLRTPKEFYLHKAVMDRYSLNAHTPSRSLAAPHFLRPCIFGSMDLVS